ncbi:hypothetical protein [Paraburkholderia aromaticivorans]|uniref:hypothetical protein n=1 Tax=Paraburkholderia aromaticivorans TaxID=2026199 RepID=UPI0014560E58|nr:hypothetical protein [Paraburkholderia aromaticivorans]
MNQSMRHWPYLLLIILSGCGSLTSESSVDGDRLFFPKITGTTVCVVQNRQVAIPDLNDAIVETVNEYGFRARSIADEEDISSDCSLALIYSADREWDIVHYLRTASFRLLKDGITVRSINYTGSDGLVLDKYQSTKKRIAPAMRALFHDVSPTM